RTSTPTSPGTCANSSSSSRRSCASTARGRRRTKRIRPRAPSELGGQGGRGHDAGPDHDPANEAIAAGHVVAGEAGPAGAVLRAGVETVKRALSGGGADLA